MHHVADDQPEGGALELPTEGGVLPLFGTVIYPQTVTPLAISQPSAVQLVDQALAGSGMLALVALRAEASRPAVVGPAQCYPVGTLALIHRLLRLPDGTLRVAAEGIERVRIEGWESDNQQLRGRFVPMPDQPCDQATLAGLLTRTIEQVRALAQFVPVLTDDVQAALANDDPPERLSYLLAMGVAAHSSVAERQELLELDSAARRLDRVCALVEAMLDRIRQRTPTTAETHSPSQGVLERRPELRHLPLVQEALNEGRVAGARSLLAALLRARFGDDGRLAVLLARAEDLGEYNDIERLALLASGASNLDAVIEAL